MSFTPLLSAYKFRCGWPRCNDIIMVPQNLLFKSYFYMYTQPRVSSSSLDHLSLGNISHTLWRGFHMYVQLCAARLSFSLASNERVVVVILKIGSSTR